MMPAEIAAHAQAGTDVEAVGRLLCRHGRRRGGHDGYCGKCGQYAAEGGVHLRWSGSAGGYCMGVNVKRVMTPRHIVWFRRSLPS